MAQLYNCTRAKLVHYSDVVGFAGNGRWIIRQTGKLFNISPASSVSYDTNQSDVDGGKVEQLNVTISIETRYLPKGLDSALKYFVCELPDGHGGFIYVGSPDYPAVLTINKDKLYSTLNISANLAL